MDGWLVSYRVPTVEFFIGGTYIGVRRLGNTYYPAVGHLPIDMDDTLAFLGLTATGAVLYGAVLARLKVRSWLGARRLAALEADIEDRSE